MKSSRAGWCILYVALLSHITVAQTQDIIGSGSLSPTRHTDNGFLMNASQGFLQTIRVWDLSLAGLGALYQSRPGERDDQLDFTPFGVDNQFSRSVVRNNEGQLLGSRLHPVKIQTWILLGQLGATTLLDVLTDAEITPLEYEKPFVFAKAMIYTYGVTEITKGWVYRSRPDGSDGKSFFSGHASGSFAAAAFIYREISDWADAGPLRRSETGNTVLKAAAFSLCYGWATYVGYARIHDRKHYLSDVLTGAAVGTLIGNLVYDWHFSAPDNRASNLHFTFNPSSRPSIGFTYRF